MAFARHNIEKNRLIEMVRQNPILWDCRLPHYKRSDKKKQIKWCELGRAFNVSGERVQRTFTSLRELFRRELNHEKLFGARFTSKWEYYGAMSFLKDVIRERKTRDNSDIFNKDMIDEHSNFTKPSKTDFLSPEVIINDSPVLHEISSSGSSTPSISMKEEPTDNDDHDDEEGLKKAPISNKRRRRNKHTNMPNTENMWSKSGSAPSTSNHQGSSAIKYNQPSNSYQYSKRYSDNDEDYMQRDEDLSKVIFKPTPREILYTKFGEFLSAQLNVLNETVANELMNKILLLVAENR